MSGVKGIDFISPIKSKGTSNSDSLRRRRITMSERNMLASSNPQPVSQFNPITGELIMSCANVNFSGIAPVVSDKLTDLEKDKFNVGKDTAPKHKASVKNPAAVVYKARKQKTPIKKPAGVVEKPDAVVDKALAKQPDSVVVQDKDNVTAPAKTPAFIVVQDKDDVVVNDHAELDQEKDKEKQKAPAKEPASVVGSVCDVVKQILFNVEDALKNKAADVKEKSDGKGKKSVVDKDNDNGIDFISPIKSKGTSNSDSLRRRRITMSERNMLASSNPQPVSQFNPITGELIMSCANVNFSGIAPVVSDKLTDLEKDKVNVGKDKAPKHKASVKNPAAVVYKARKQKTPIKKPAGVVEKPDAVVDKALAKQPDSVVVQDKDNVTAPAKTPASIVVQDKDNVVILFNVEDALKNKAIEKASDVVNDSVVVESVCDVVKASDALKNKAADVKEKSDGKGKKSVVDKDNDNV
nr:hypothetical protein [Tanacetum cinerariifolium]